MTKLEKAKERVVRAAIRFYEVGNRAAVERDFYAEITAPHWYWQSEVAFHKACAALQAARRYKGRKRRGGDLQR